MEYITDLKNFKIKEKTAVTIGKFDGIHLGHQKLMNNVLGKKKNGYKTVVFTFDMPPMAFFNGEKPQMLLTNTERKCFLEKLNIDYMIECHFTHEIASMEPEAFIKEILHEKLNAAYISVGDDCRFGNKARGNCEMLCDMSKIYGYEVEIVPKVRYNNEIISSTLIRKYIDEGKLNTVNAMLGYSYCIEGTVIHGNELGRTIGMPTANIWPPENKKLPPHGVYVSRVWIGDKAYKGITNIGFKPTVSNEKRVGVETNIFNFNQDIYGKEIKVELFHFRRPEQKFNSLEELKGAVLKDMQYGVNYHIDNTI